MIARPIPRMEVVRAPTDSSIALTERVQELRYPIHTSTEIRKCIKVIYAPPPCVCITLNELRNSFSGGTTKSKFLTP